MRLKSRKGRSQRVLLRRWRPKGKTRLFLEGLTLPGKESRAESRRWRGERLAKEATHDPKVPLRTLEARIPRDEETIRLELPEKPGSLQNGGELRVSSEPLHRLPRRVERKEAGLTCSVILTNKISVMRKNRCIGRKAASTPSRLRSGFSILQRRRGRDDQQHFEIDKTGAN